MKYFTERHQSIHDKIKKEYQRLLKLYSVKSFTDAIGDDLKISPITVINYIHGRIKDGYLAEDILSKLKKIK